MSLWDNVVNYRRYKLAIMWSGGMDTTIAYFYALKHGYKEEDIIMIHLNIGEPYENKQLIAINKLKPNIKSTVRIFGFNLLRKEFGNIPTIDLQIIPGRNLMIAYLGAYFADRVWIGALDGEMHDFMPDKNDLFFNMTSNILSYILDKNIIVETPFKNYTKSDILTWMVTKYGKKYTEEILNKTVTCYDKYEWACGKCSACFKRWISYVNAGLDWNKYWKINPKNSDIAINMVKKYKMAEKNKDYTHYSKKRINETFTAINKEE